MPSVKTCLYCEKSFVASTYELIQHVEKCKENEGASVFTPITIINDMCSITEKNSPAWIDLQKLKSSILYAAPEIRDAIFWGKLRGKSIVKICSAHFNDSEEIFNIYTTAVKRYNLTGFVWRDPNSASSTK